MMNRLTQACISSFLLLPVCLFSQAKVYNTSLVNSDSNILYVGFPNIIEIRDSSNKSYGISFSKAKFSFNETNSYTVYADEEGNDAMQVFDDKHRIIFSVRYESRDVKHPYVRLGYISDSILTTKRIISQSQLLVILPYCLLKQKVAVKSYRISFRSGDPKINSYNKEIQGDILNKESQRMVKKLKKGDKLVFDNIVAAFPFGKERLLPPLIITIK